MRKNLSYLMIAVFAAAAAFTSCSGKKESAHEEGHHEHHDGDSATADSWVPMDEFHMLMAESFHPYKDSSNLAPSKANADAMATAAARWQSEPLPEKVNNDAVRAQLEKLKASTAAFAETVKTGDDKVIADSLASLHDLFHEIQESWYGGKGHHHHH